MRILIASVLLLLGASPAAANELEDGINYFFLRAEKDSTGACIDRLPAKTAQVQSILPADPALSDTERQRVAEIVGRAIPHDWNRLDADVVGDEVRDSGFYEDGPTPSQREANLRAAPLTVRTTVKRTRVSSAVIEVVVVVRHLDAELKGVECASSKAAFNVDLSTFDRSDDEPGDVEVASFSKAFALARLLPAGTSRQAAIPVVISTQFSGADCKLSRDELMQALKAASPGAAAAAIDRIISNERLDFTLRESEEGVEGPLLRLVATPTTRAFPDDRGRVAALSFEWREGGEARGTNVSVVALPPGALASCRGNGPATDAVDLFLADARQNRRLGVDLVGEPRGRLGRPLTFELDVQEADLSAFCAVLVDDGAWLLYPGTRKQARRGLRPALYAIPADFGLPPDAIKTEGDAGAVTLHCFVSTADVDEALANEWLERTGRIVPWAAASAMARDFRAQPEVFELWQRVVIESE